MLASAIRIDGGAANDRQQKRMLWLRDNKFILDVILDTPDALSHVIGHASALNPLNFPPHCITRHRSVREVLPAVQRLLPSPPPARSIPPGELPSVPPHPHPRHFMPLADGSSLWSALRQVRHAVRDRSDSLPRKYLLSAPCSRASKLRRLDHPVAQGAFPPARCWLQQQPACRRVLLPLASVRARHVTSRLTRVCASGCRGVPPAVCLLQRLLPIKTIVGSSFTPHLRSPSISIRISISSCISSCIASILCCASNSAAVESRQRPSLAAAAKGHASSMRQPKTAIFCTPIFFGSSSSSSSSSSRSSSAAAESSHASEQRVQQLQAI